MSISTAPVVHTPNGAESPGEAPLPILQTAGFSVTVDAYAWERDPDPASQRMHLWFLSLLGSQEAVKAVWARLIKGEPATMLLEHLGTTRFCALAPEGPRRWRFLTASLRAVAAYHGVLVPEAALYTAERTDFLLLPRSSGDEAELHGRFLNRRLDLPLHPLWATWLWERGLRTAETVPLESLGIDAYRCLPNPEALAGDLGKAIRRGMLAIPAEPNLPAEGQ
jgi:hypothetical protein